MKLRNIGKKIFLLAGTFCALNLVTVEAAPQTISLPAPQISEEVSLAQALNNRKSTRKYSAAPLTEKQLSNILWAANGINRAESGGRVNPAALNIHAVEVYAVTADGIYFYDSEKHELKLIAEGDFRGTTTMGQNFVEAAALSLVYVENPDAWKKSFRPISNENQKDYSEFETGAMIQSVGLVAAAEGLGNCVRGSVNREAFAKAAKLPKDKIILLAQTVGVAE